MLSKGINGRLGQKFSAAIQRPAQQFSQLANISSAHSINPHNSSASATPLIEHYRPRWPQPPLPSAPSGDVSSLDGVVPILNIPAKRSIPATALRFSLSATFSHGSSIYYSHLQYHPADFKVSLKVILNLHSRYVTIRNSF